MSFVTSGRADQPITAAQREQLTAIDILNSAPLFDDAEIPLEQATDALRYRPVNLDELSTCVIRTIVYNSYGSCITGSSAHDFEKYEHGS